MILVPRCWALTCFATENPFKIDAGILVPAERGDELEVYRQYAELLEQQTEPVYKKFDVYDHDDLLEAFAKSDREAGERIVICQRLSEITRPGYFYEPGSNWAKALQKYYKICYGFSDQRFHHHLERRRQRHEQFTQRVTTSRYRYIYYEKDLLEFIRTGDIYPHYYWATLEERLDQLKELRRLITESEDANFEIAIIHPEDEAVLGTIKPTFCEVKENLMTVMEVPIGKIEQGYKLQRWFLIEDPAIISAFQKYLSQLWDKLQPKSKDQLSTFNWLNRHIRELEEQIKCI